MLEHELSVAVCLVLLLTYVGHLVFSLITHKDFFNPEGEEGHGDVATLERHHAPGSCCWSPRCSWPG